MENLQIIPGAIVEEKNEVKEEQEVFYRQLRSLKILPEKGGVGKLPLPIWHQGNLPICTGVAAANCRMIEYYLTSGKMINLSALFVYQMNRLFDGLAWNTKGSTLHASMQTLRQKGICLEKMYPTTVENCARKFPGKYTAINKIMSNADKYRINNYARCENLEDVLVALAEKHPVAFSMIIYTDFYAAVKGRVSPYIQGELVGGHSMVALNYDLRQEYIEVVQSWGKSKSGPTDNGYMYIPFNWFERKMENDLPLMFEAFVLL